MIQSSVFWAILIVSTIVYWLLPHRFRYGFLAGVSYAYLITLDPVVVTTVVAWSIGVFYLAPHALAEKRGSRLIVPGLVLSILTYLIYYKYNGHLSLLWPALATGSLVVPIGISYFTFKLIHYAIEVGRGNIVDRSLQRFFCYIFLFPIFTAGPIERFDNFLENSENKWQLQSTVEGLTRIVHGFIKLFVVGHIIIGQWLQPALLGREFGDLATSREMLAVLSELDALHVWFYLALTFLYTYMDFSAYSDIAIGASRLYGFRILENFNFPLAAKNISDFWKRWHMTLAGWCQRYVYLPTIGITRKPYVAVYATFITMGLWHGGYNGSWNWLLWGFYHATGVSIYLTWSRLKRNRGWNSPRDGLFRHIGVPMTFMFVTGSHAFSSTSLLGPWAALRVFGKLFGMDL